MQTSERPNSPSIRHTWATGGTPESWQDRDASQNQRQLGLDGVTSPAAHCPRRLPPGQNQGGTSLVFVPFLLFYSKGEGFELFLWLSALFIGRQRPKFPPFCPSKPSYSFFCLALPTSKEGRAEDFWTFLFDIPSEFWLRVYISVFTLLKTFVNFFTSSQWLVWTDPPLWRSPTKTWGSSSPTIPPTPPWTSSSRWAQRSFQLNQPDSETLTCSLRLPLFCNCFFSSQELKKYGVTTVVRVCEATYDATLVVKEGIQVLVSCCDFTVSDLTHSCLLSSPNSTFPKHTSSVGLVFVLRS